MKSFCFNVIFFSSCVVGLLLHVSGVEARENVLQGAVSLGNNYDSNVFKTHSGDVDEWRTVVSPELSLQSTGASDTIAFEYAPDVSYNHRRDEDTLSHDVTLSGEKALSSHWQVSFSDNYTYFDNPVFETDVTLSLVEQFRRADTATQAEIVRLLFSGLAWDPDLY